MGTLYIVGTPIGNLEDISLRALRVLKEADLIAAEDTRRTRKLLTHYRIATPLISYFEHSRPARLEVILTALEDKDVALVSEAGMPGLSDPGYRLVKAAVERGVPVVPVPGPSAPVVALAVSGLPTDSFLFVGFLPRRAGERRRLLESLSHQRYTLVAFEAPHRLLQSLSDLVEILGDRQVVVARELTKVHEDIWRGSLSEALAHFEALQPRGEFTLVIEGMRGKEREKWDEERVKEMLKELLAEGLGRKEAVKRVAKSSGWPGKEVYALSLGD